MKFTKSDIAKSTIIIIKTNNISLVIETCEVTRDRTKNDVKNITYLIT